MLMGRCGNRLGEIDKGWAKRYEKAGHFLVRSLTNFLVSAATSDGLGFDDLEELPGGILMMLGIGQEALGIC